MGGRDEPGDCTTSTTFAGRVVSIGNATKISVTKSALRHLTSGIDSGRSRGALARGPEHELARRELSPVSDPALKGAELAIGKDAREVSVRPPPS